MPLYEIAKDPNFTIGDGHESAAHVLHSVCDIAKRFSVANVAIVLNVNGNYYTYGFELDRAVMLDCATALTEWAKQID